MRFPVRRPPTPPDISALASAPRPVEPIKVPRFVAIPPWYDTPIPPARNFFSVTKPLITVPAGVGNSVFSTQATGGAFQIPQLMVGVVTAVAVFVDAPNLTTNLTFIFRQNFSPIPGLEAVGFAPRVAANLQLDIGGTFVVSEGVLLDCQILNLSAFAWNVSVTLTGWYNSPEDVYRFTGMRPASIA